MIHEVLERLRTAPATASSLARALGTPREVMDTLLAQLERRGYVAQAFEGAQACSTGCGSCSVQRLCPSSGVAEPPMPVWRLTAKGAIPQAR